MCLFICCEHVYTRLFPVSHHSPVEICLPSAIIQSHLSSSWRFLLYNSCCVLLTDAQCKTTAKADIVLLVDGSWSIGRLNFKTIRAFIGRMVGVFDIGPDRVQIGKCPLPLFTSCFSF